jgi:hypothetical protein
MTISNIFVYGDSHASYNFIQLAITMHHVGRNNCIANFDPTVHDTYTSFPISFHKSTCLTFRKSDFWSNQDSIIILCYGEIDCRCHIQRQINASGRTEDEVIQDLVNAYFQTIRNNVIIYKQIIVCAVIPPMHQDKYESVHDALATAALPPRLSFVGSDEDRVRFTQRMNFYLQQKCTEYQYTFMNPYDGYADESGCLKNELSDTLCHIKDSTPNAAHTISLLSGI